MNNLENGNITYVLLPVAAQNWLKLLPTPIITGLGALAKLRRATISFFVSVVLRTFPILLRIRVQKERTFAIKTLLLILLHFKHCPL